jgi:teichoic acid transport system ATP-binding protein
METGHRNPARLLAPIALVVFGIGLLTTLVTAGQDEKSKSASEASREERRDLKTKRERRERRREEERERRSSRSTYVVQTGDTLGGISEETGVSVERLQELNPNLDPQALVSGQRLKLR